MARRLLNWFGTVLFLSYSLFLSVPLCARAFACCSFEKKQLLRMNIMAMGVDNPRRPLSFASPADTGTCRGPPSLFPSLPFELHSQHYCPVPSPRPQNRDSAVHRFRLPVLYFTRTIRILLFRSFRTLSTYPYRPHPLLLRSAPSYAYGYISNRVQLTHSTTRSLASAAMHHLLYSTFTMRFDSNVKVPNANSLHANFGMSPFVFLVSCSIDFKNTLQTRYCYHTNSKFSIKLDGTKNFSQNNEKFCQNNYCLLH